MGIGGGVCLAADNSVHVFPIFDPFPPTCLRLQTFVHDL